MGCTNTMPTAKEKQTYQDSKRFGDQVFIFDDTMDMDSINKLLSIYNEQQAFNEFGFEHYAFLFKPGVYDVEVTVDYYMQVMGLGKLPGDVTIRGAVQSTTTTGGKIPNKVTTMFWRGAENMKVEPTDDKMMYWAVSQAAPYRRMHVVGEINFDKGSWASGGALINSVIQGRAGLTTGQQWMTRNSTIDRWEGGNWNRVFIGVEGAPEDTWPKQPTTVIEKTPVSREKPFLTINERGEYAVFVSEVRRETSGPTWNTDEEEKGFLIPLNDFFIAKPNQDNAETINAALAEGKHLLLTPGIYRLEETIRVSRPNTVVLGLGLPTLIPQTGKVALATTDVGGIKIAGLMVDAGPQLSSTLIQVGTPDSNKNHEENPTSLHDIYCRIGGAVEGQAETAVTIHSNHVIGDHFWLWRADHGIGTAWGSGQNKHGLVVYGDHVAIYGLFNEHFQHYQTLWNGEYGSTYFYQSEIPYRPPSNEVWNDNGKPGFASYKVAEHVQYHKAFGLGIYSFFKGKETIENKVRLENAIEVPNHKGILIKHIATFSGPDGGINHPINGEGPVTEGLQLKLYDGYRGKE